MARVHGEWLRVLKSKRRRRLFPFGLKSSAIDVFGLNIAGEFWGGGNLRRTKQRVRWRVRYGLDAGVFRCMDRETQGT